MSYNPPVKIKPDAFIKHLVSRAYPSYNGRKYRLQVSESSIDCASYWDEGHASTLPLRTLQLAK